MKKYCVYLIVFPNSKRYCGFSGNMTERKNTHRQKSTKSTLLVYNAIRKYGYENLIWEIVQDGLSLKDALQLEIKMIKDNRLTDNRYGYNLSAGGIGGLGRSPSETTRQKLREKMIGWDRTTPEQRKILIACMKLKNKDKIFREKARIGRETSEKYKRWGKQLGELALKNQGKPIQCLNDGQYFGGIKMACRHYQLDPNYVRKMLSGKIPNVKGYVFIYASPPLEVL